MSKEYKIKTVEDIMRCTNPDNLDNFLVDLKGIIQAVHALDNIAPVKMEGFNFIWIDDGQHRMDIEINAVNE